MIDDYKYGCFWADGKEFLGDLKIKNNKAHYWQDLEDRKLKVEHFSSLLNEDCDVFVIGTGAGGMLEVGKEINETLTRWVINRQKKPFFYIKKNTEAIKIINDSIKNGKNVCAVLPAGC